MQRARIRRLRDRPERHFLLGRKAPVAVLVDQQHGLHERDPDIVGHLCRKRELTTLDRRRAEGVRGQDAHDGRCVVALDGDLRRLAGLDCAGIVIANLGRCRRDGKCSSGLSIGDFDEELEREHGVDERA